DHGDPGADGWLRRCRRRACRLASREHPGFVPVALMRVSCVILTRGDRADDVARAVQSAQAQEGVDVEVVVIGNGADPGSFGPGVRSERLPDNVGIAAGRNYGVRAS